MKKPTVLALVARHYKTNAISVLALTQDYAFKLIPRAPGSRVGPTIEVLKKDDATGPAAKLPVDSLTVVYGENGEGKTSLLLDVCRTLTPYRGDRPLGVIWRDKAGVARLERGKGQDTVRLSGSVVENDDVVLEDRFRSVFYTTSPFETGRRRYLTADGTIDATPSFGTNSFSGTALCFAAGSLPKDIPFIRRTRVRLQFAEQVDIEDALGKLFTVDELHIHSKDASHWIKRNAKRIAALKQAVAGLSPRNKSILAIEMLRARQDGPKQVDGLAMDLLERNGGVFRSNQAFSTFLSARESHLKYRIPSRMVQRSLEELRKLDIANDPKDLNAVADLLRGQSDMLSAGLNEAERLGLLHWEFLELSSGQVALLMLFASLAASLENLRARGTRSVMLVIDEGEMFMHPAWQRKYLKDLMAFIDHFRKSFDELHLVLATHSLIVAGDAPPHRLFDVKSGEMRNGFAYGPKEVLTDVYGVEEFAGNMSEALYARIVGFLRGTRQPDPKKEDEVRSLIQQIASPQLRTYLLEELQRRRLHQHA